MRHRHVYKRKEEARSRKGSAAEAGCEKRASQKTLRATFTHLLLPVIALASLAGVAGYLVWPTEAPGFANGYAYRRAIEINSTYVEGSGSHTDFPVLFSGTFDYLKTTTHGGKVETDNGFDIIFSTSTEGVELLDFEIEKYSSTTGEIAAWVRLPSLSTSATTTFYMFYGSSTISASLERATSTWDTNYQGVWHLSETSGQHLDSTDNNNDSTSVAVTTQGAAQGMVGGADDFDGVNDVVTIPDSTSLDLANAGTIEAWVKTYDVSTAESNFSAWQSRSAPNGAGLDEYSSVDSVIVGDTIYYGAILCNNSTETFSTATSSVNGGSFSGWTTHTAPNGCGASEGAHIAVDSDGDYLYYAVMAVNDAVHVISFASSTLSFSSFSSWNTTSPGATTGVTDVADQSAFDMTITGGFAYLAVTTVSNGVEDFFTTVVNLKTGTSSAWVDQANNPDGASNNEGCSVGVASDGLKLFYASRCHQSGTLDYYQRASSTFSGSSLGAWSSDTAAANGSGQGEKAGNDIVIIGDRMYHALFNLNDTNEHYYSGISPLYGSDVTWTYRTSGGAPNGGAASESADASLASDGKNLFYTAFTHNNTVGAFYTASSALPAHPFLSKASAYEMIQTGKGYFFDWSGRPHAFGTTTTVGNFEHVVVTQDGSEMRYYINGALIRTQKTTTDFATNAENLLLGSGKRGDGTSIYFNGVIDEVRISDIARSADWIKTQYNNISGTSTFYWIGSEVTDTAPPTPNPMTFATPPGGGDPTALAMIATQASDDSIPLEYFFSFHPCASNGGTGGTQSGWQSGTSYTDTGLQGNKCYGYRVAARDRLGNTTASSSLVEVYTAAYTPNAPTVSAPTANTLTLTNNENGNPASNPTTYFAVRVLSTTPPDVSWLNRYVDASGNPSASPVWLTDAQIDNLAVQGLQSGTSYGFAVRARNQDGKETPFSGEGSGTTSGTAPTADPNTRLRGVRLKGGDRLR